MSPVKLIIGSALVLFTVIGTASLVKSKKHSEPSSEIAIQEIAVEEISSPKKAASIPTAIVVEEKKAPLQETPTAVLPEANLIERLFTLDGTKLPIVETVSYTSRAPWLKGRPAWIADYATHYATSRHFIARSLNRKPDYITQKVSPGDKFNVFRKDKEIQFHLLIDLSRCKMWFYYIDTAAGERVLLKTYQVGLGRKDTHKASGFLTPTGKYKLGSKIAIYKPGSMGYFQEKKTEMIRVFGTRWIPFEEELGACSEPAKGFGIHGSPWAANSQGSLTEDKDHVGKYDSDGCIRLNSEDMEELFSIIITKPTTVELVSDFHKATLPGVERKVE